MNSKIKVSHSLSARIISIIMVFIILSFFFFHDFENPYMNFKSMLGVLYSPFFLVYTCFFHIVIHEKGIDTVIGQVDKNMDYHGYLLNHLDWQDIKVVFDHKYLIKFISIDTNKKIIIRQVIMNYKPALPLISKYGRNNLSKEELLVFDDELEKKKNYRNFSKIFYGKE